MKKHSNENGVILISVLVFMMAISLLITTAFKFSEMEMQMSLNSYLETQAFQTAQTGLFFAYTTLDKKKNVCQIQNTTPENLVNKPNTWWQSNSCCHNKVGKESYQFVFESLQTEPCDIINKKYAADYWRITVRVGGKNKPISIIQATIAKPIKTNKVCKSPKRKITEGLQSWRELR